MAVSDCRLAAGALAACLALAVLHTWPLAANPGVLSRHDNADAMLNEWIVAWVAHQAPRAPLHLFDANIFHPEPRALAFSEHMTVQGLMGAPVSWLGGSPLLAFNLLVMAGLALSAWSMWLLLERWTGSRAAGAIAGTLFAFNAHTLTRLPHLQALHLEFLPVVLLALDRVLVERRVRDALLLGLAAALQGLTSNYLLVFTAMAAAVGFAVRLNEWRRPAPARTAALLALAAGVAALLLAPFLYPYYLTQREQGLTRSLDEVALYSSTWRDYLSTAGRVHYAAWSYRFLEGSTALFPGGIALVLASVALVSSPGLRDARVRMAAALGVAGLALSFGPALPGYALLYRWMPLLQGVRGAARFGFLALVAIAILAGFGVAALRGRWGARAWWPALVAALVVGVNAEALRAPLDVQALRRHSARLPVAPRSLGHRRRRVSLLRARGRVPQRPVRPELDRVLEAPRERLQRVRSPQLPGDCGGAARLPGRSVTSRASAPRRDPRRCASRRLRRSGGGDGLRSQRDAMAGAGRVRGPGQGLQARHFLTAGLGAALAGGLAAAFAGAPGGPAGFSRVPYNRR